MRREAVGPPGMIGGDGGRNEIAVCRGGVVTLPEHVSKGEGYPLRPGDWVQVRTPGGGYGDPAERDPALVARDVRRGYFPPEQSAAQYGSDREIE